MLCDAPDASFILLILHRRRHRQTRRTRSGLRGPLAGGFGIWLLSVVLVGAQQHASAPREQNTLISPTSAVEASAYEGMDRLAGMRIIPCRKMLPILTETVDPLVLGTCHVHGSRLR